MKPNRVKEKLLSGRAVFGTFVFFPEPGLVEIIGHAGYDFVALDLEHSALDMKDIQSLIRAADAVNITPLVRVGEMNGYVISRALDAGAQGLVMPHLGSPDDAREMVALTKYPPLGRRPACTGTRATQYTATPFSEHVEQSNQDILLAGLVEDASAADGIDQILDVPGIDVLLPGPADLGVSLNVPGNFEHPRVIEKVEKVIGATLRRDNVYAGMYVSTTDQAERWLKKGVKLIFYSIDCRVIYDAYREALSKLKSFLPS
jgi:4-hydroxy-2-oxoheptanedioate aldolase